MDYDRLLDKACAHIKKIPNGQIFFVKELFYGTDWNELNRGEKLSFGRYFKSAVVDKRISKVRFIGKANNNSSQYQKIQEEEE